MLADWMRCVQAEVVGQPEGAVAPNLGSLTLQALPALPTFDKLLPSASPVLC